MLITVVQLFQLNISLLFFPLHQINSPVFLHVPCHSRCYWKAGLGVQRGDEISWTSVYVFDTEEVGPLVGGNVTNVTWSDDTGTQLQVIVKVRMSMCV